MKICPECKKTFDDSATNCPDDYAALLDDAQRLPDNPDLKQVVSVRPDEKTALVDLEAMEDKLREHEDRRRQEAERLAKERAAAEEERRRAADPNVTRAVDLSAVEKSRKPAPASTTSAKEPSSVKEQTASQTAAATADATESKVDREDADENSLKPDDTILNRPLLKDAPVSERWRAGAVVVGLLVVSGLVALGATKKFSSTKDAAVLTVTTIPVGAMVLLDGKNLGTSPVQSRVATGAHTIELTLEGYETFRDVVDVPPVGVEFLQPLERSTVAASVATADAGTVADAGNDDANVPDRERRASECFALLDSDSTTALDCIRRFIADFPDDERGVTLLASLQTASQKPGKTGTNIGSKPGRKQNLSALYPGRTAKERERNSRQAFQDGEREYRARRFDDAAELFSISTRLDPNFAMPHRSLARLAETGGDIKRARYHLERYLSLGGPDSDKKVTRWLDDNPK